MPSPIGHAAAGLIVALADEKRTRMVNWSLIVACMVLAASPDLDWLIPGFHRGATHSIGFTVIVTLLTAAVTRFQSGKTNWRVATVCGLAYGSHIVMDWLGEDPTANPGVAALWPFTGRRFISGLNLFRSTMRVDAFVSPQLEHNMVTLAQEVLILAPFLLLVLWQRRKLRG